MRTLILCALCCLLPACSSAEQRTYDVYVQNNTKHVLTFGLVKNGGPPEAKWAAPEDIEYSKHSSDAKWGYIVEPGQVGHLTLAGKFDARVSAVLRVYADKNLVDDLVAVASYDPYRIREIIPPGKHMIAIEQTSSGLAAIPVHARGAEPPP